MYADGTGLLTDAMHVGRGAWPLPFPMRDGTVGAAGWHSRSEVRLRARITVAGQWRSLTALPEHSESGQRVLSWTAGGTMPGRRRNRVRL